MNIEKHIPSQSELYTFYEEIPESFLDEIDVDICFYHNIVDIVLIDDRIARVSKGSNKKSFAFQLFHFCNLKNQRRFILEEEVSVPLKELAAILNTHTSVFETAQQSCQISNKPSTQSKARFWSDFILRRTVCTILPRHQRH